MKDKIKKILIPWRENLERKWWHRFISVFIYGSTTIVIIIAMIIPLTDKVGWEYKYTSYSFEPGYSMASGRVVDCKFYAYDYISPLIDCGDISKSTDFLTRYAKARGTYDNLQKIRLESKTIDLSYDNFQKTKSGSTDDQILNAGIKEGKFNDIKVKREINILYGNLIKYFFIALLIILSWFIFWESIVYRIVIYIVYGKNKTI